MKIINATKKDSAVLANIISESNKDVAERFDLTRQNNPKHPSFYTEDWARSDFDRGEKYFLAQLDGIFIGCVAFESPDPSISYLNRLSVLPKYRCRGIGEKLVRHVIEYSKNQEIYLVSIGIIAKFSELKDWYIKLGFIEGETRSFQHLPFDVMYLTYRILTR